MSLRSLPTGWPTGVDLSQVIAFNTVEGIRYEGTSGVLVTYMYIYLTTGPVMKVELGKTIDPETLEAALKIKLVLMSTRAW